VNTRQIAHPTRQQKMKIIYLDQFVLRKAFCPSQNDEHTDFFLRVGHICNDLARKRVASFPFSESHLSETALLTNTTQRQIIAENFNIISNGYQFVSRINSGTTGKGRMERHSHQLVAEPSVVSRSNRFPTTTRIGLQKQRGTEARLCALARLAKINAVLHPARGGRFVEVFADTGFTESLPRYS
jgi:hypothetical protein